MWADVGPRALDGGHGRRQDDDDQDDDDDDGSWGFIVQTPFVFFVTFQLWFFWPIVMIDWIK